MTMLEQMKKLAAIENKMARKSWGYVQGTGEESIPKIVYQPNPPLTQTQLERAVSLHNRGIGIERIAKIMKTSRYAISKAFVDCGQINIPFSKLPVKAQRIKLMLDDGATQSQISRLIGASLPSIKNMIKRYGLDK